METFTLLLIAGATLLFLYWLRDRISNGDWP
jgi:hypothetical protein